MDRKILYYLILITCFILLSSAPASALLTLIQPEAGEYVVYDGVNCQWWFPDLSEFNNMTYSEQLQHITSINTSSYGGINNWHLADGDELNLLTQQVDTIPEAQLFTPSSTNSWFGRDDLVGFISGTHIEAGYSIDSGQVHWQGGPISDSASGNFGAWVVANCQTPVPEPATMLLFGAGLVSLAGFGRKKFKK
jgi:hypothetical protein